MKYVKFIKRGAFIGVAAALFLVFIALKYGGNICNTAIQYTTNMTQKNKVVEQPAEKVVPTVTPVISSTVKIKFKEIPKELLNPTGEVISTIVKPAYREKLVEMLKKMKQLPAGVGPWRIIYCNNGKLMFYNYNHMIAFNYNEKEKGIYSILDFSNLKVGSYQGSEVVTFNFSPDGNYMLLGTFSMEIDLKSDKSLYIYNVNNGTIKEITTNFNMRDENIIWYNNVHDSSSKWVFSAKDNKKNTVLWDVDKVKALKNIPIDVKMVLNKNTFLNWEDLKFTDDKGNITKLVTENYIESFWFKDNNTLFAVQSTENIKLMDFQVVEINISDKTGKVIFIQPASDSSNARKVAQEFGRALCTVDAKQVAEYKKIFSPITRFSDIPKIVQSHDKNIQPLMTRNGYTGIVASRYDILITEICAMGDYTSQVTDLILDKNLYEENEDKAGYYYEAKLKFISTTGKAEAKDATKGYIGLLKENGQWKVSTYSSTTSPALFEKLHNKKNSDK